jgi:site-specific DNA recombinase
LKQAISYIRISNRDQSNFSLSGQKEFIDQFCARKEIKLIGSFDDNGQSAKNFDRADWKKLEDFIKKNHKQIDYLIVVKYDRFSRNVSEGLAMIDKLEKTYGIAILSVFEEIAISPESPFFFKMRTDMLVQAEFELRVIRDRTKFGINQAKREGRWVTRAPYGYTNKRDQNNKPVIKIQHTNSLIVKKIFKMFISGVPMSEILGEVKVMGYSQRSNSAITRVLTCPVYAGLLPLGGEYVKGIHEPIIDMETFNHAQRLLNKETKIKILVNDEVPLRGVIHCDCGRLLTAGKSKGRTRYYWYYKCKSHLDINYNSSVIEIGLQKMLKELSLNQGQIDKFKYKFEKSIQERLKSRKESVSGLERKIAATQVKLKSVEEKFIMNQIKYESYSDWNTTYNSELNEYKAKLTLWKTGEENIWVKYEKYCSALLTMDEAYNALNTIKKQQFLHAVFNHTLKYRLNLFLADYLLPIFASQAPELKKKGLLIINSPSSDFGNFTISSGIGSVVELFEILKYA